MKLLGVVLEVFSASAKESSLPRPVVPKLEMILGHGIKNDKFAQKDENRSVMIVGKHSYERALHEGIALENGSFGENILFDFDPHDLSLKSTLVMDEVEIALTKECTVCAHLAFFHKKLPQLLQGKRGVYCKILKSGTVKKGVKVYLKENG